MKQEKKQDTSDWETIKKDNDISTRSKANKIYESTNDVDYALTYDKLSRIGTKASEIEYLRGTKYTNEQKGRLLAEKHASSGSAVEKDLISQGKYADVYAYNEIKVLLDTDKSGRISKKEKENLIPVIQGMKYGKLRQDEYASWFR